MKEEIKIPEGCKVDTITTENGSVVVTFKVKDPQLPETWVEFCEKHPIEQNECFIDHNSVLSDYLCKRGRDWKEDRNLLPDRATAKAVLALCQLIKLRDCYNQGWCPNWEDYYQDKFTIEFHGNKIFSDTTHSTVLYFKSAELRDMFLDNFRDIIEKLKPLYGIKEGGEEWE